MLEINSSSDISMFPTATPMQRTFLSWNLMVDLISVTLAPRSSLWLIGEGNLPALETLACGLSWRNEKDGDIVVRWKQQPAKRQYRPWTLTF